MRKTKSINNIALRVRLCILLFVLCLVSLIPSVSAQAADTTLSGVLSDLKKDPTFNVASYPIKDGDYSLDVIQIAEGKNGGLYVYVYQPNQTTVALVATEINMSLSESVSGTKLYSLTLISCEDVFCKYKVNNVVVSDEAIRYYNISSIYREWQDGIDEETGNDDTKNAVAFHVGKCFKAVTDKSGDIVYSLKIKQTIKILNPYAGTLRYYDSFSWGFLGSDYKYTDAHFIAFDTDLRIDTLKEADVSFYTQSYECKNGKYTYEQAVEHSPITVTGTQMGGNVGDGFLAIKYEWERIQTSTAFLNNKDIDIDDTAKTEIKKAKWVFVFWETEAKWEVFVTTTPTIVDKNKWTGTRVSNVTVLRLEFESNGKCYNLGTVSDKITEGEKPVGGEKSLSWFDRLCLWLEQVTGVPSWVWKIIFYFLPFIIFLPILSAIFPVVGQVLSTVFSALLKAFVWVLKGVWWLICLPFRAIAVLVRKIKERGVTNARN